MIRYNIFVHFKNAGPMKLTYLTMGGRDTAFDGLKSHITNREFQFWADQNHLVDITQAVGVTREV